MLSDNNEIEKEFLKEQPLSKISQKEPAIEIKAQKTRWLVLFIFIWYAAINSYQWIEYSTITNIVMKYYNVSEHLVNWTSSIYMGLYPFFVIPASYITEKKGLRMAGIIGCLGTALGTSIKVFSVAPDRFYVVLLGQGIVSASQTLILCLPPKIAALWFKSNEVSRACSLGVFGTMLGCAIGYVASPAIVKDNADMEIIASELQLLCWVLTISMLPAVILIFIYFPNRPKYPPSVTQAEERENAEDFCLKQFFLNMLKLFLNKGFVVHCIAYGINIGVFSAVGTLLVQMVIAFFPGENEKAGLMGFLMILTGLFGSIAFGIYLDISKKYKETTFGIYLLCAISLFAFMVALLFKSMISLFITCSVVGIFLNAYMPVAFELAMELTFPSEESTTAGILMAVSQIMGVFFTTAMGYLINYVGPIWSLASLGILLSIGTIFTAFIPNDLRRQAAFSNRLAATPVSTIEK